MKMPFVLWLDFFQASSFPSNVKWHDMVASNSSSAHFKNANIIYMVYVSSILRFNSLKEPRDGVSLEEQLDGQKHGVPSGLVERFH